MLIIVRHGRTEANANGLLLGRSDVELDDYGRQQAAAVAAALGPVDCVVSSPLRRTMQTAQAISSDVVVDDRLIELNYGEWDMVPARSLSAEQWAAWRADLDFVPPGGESLRALGTRVRAACDEWAERARAETVVFVTHVSPIKAAVAWALGGTDALAWRMFVAPASIVRINIADHGPVMMTFGEQPSDVY